jgi:hypothetical protein
MEAAVVLNRSNEICHIRIYKVRLIFVGRVVSLAYMFEYLPKKGDRLSVMLLERIGAIG